MKFTLSWLKDHLDTDAGVEEIGYRLTMTGLEIEEIVDPAAGLESFVVARVVEAVPHPNAHKLRVCTVDTGSETVQVVCGAPNARAGMKGVFAPVGAYVPGTGLTLKQAAIRGVDSCGMLLSEREMGLSDAHDGIVDLQGDAPVGARAVDVMGLADPVFDVAITPNRGDCLGVRGMARDLAAAGLGRLKPLTIGAVPGGFESPIGVHLEFAAGTASACPYFVGRMVRGLRNGPSPEWLQRRLLAVGLKPISALVDITNYITFDLCRPLHVFDAAQVRGDLHVRLARPGERLRALNGRDYPLDPEMTVIADDREAEALAGVIGGERTGCTAETVDVFIESALFDPVRTAATGRKLDLQTDARYRFERGIDPAFVIGGAELATRMILELCGGEPSRLVIAGAEPPRQPAIPFRPGRLASLCGVEVPPRRIVEILDTLGFAVEGADGEPGEVWQVRPPTWRSDLDGEACVVEEVIRLHGYEHIPVVPMAREAASALPHPALDSGQRRRVLARRLLAARGLTEAVTFSFLPAAQADLFGGVSETQRLVNPISTDLDVMRPSPLPNLISACVRNAARGYPDVALFEVGPQYAGDRPADQSWVAAGVRAGRTGPRHWCQPPRDVDVFDAKADALAVLAALGVPVDRAQVTAGAPAWYHPGRSGVIRLGPKTLLAAFGDMHPRVARALDVAGRLVAFEVFLDAIPARKGKGGALRPALAASAFQPLERDFAFVVAAGLPADDLVRAVRAADDALIRDVRVFDVFTGPGVGEGQKSLAVTVILQPMERTLTDADLDAFAGRVVASVSSRTGGILRT